ncbi:MAG: hypothetical protein ACI8WB_004131 [Phenylobacterium sp.]|jgi:hypothetical protein
MYQLFATIDDFVWLADATVFALFFVLLIKEGKLSSTFISLGTIVLLDGVSLHYLSMLENIDQQAYVPQVRFSWYIGLALLHYVTIYAVFKLHWLSATPYSFITKMVFLEYCTYGIMHLVRYAERSVFQTDYLQNVYQSGILSINLSTTAVVIIFAVAVGISKFRVSKGKKGLLWTV